MGHFAPGLRELPFRILLAAILLPLLAMAAVFTWMLNVERIGELRQSLERSADIATVSVTRFIGEETAALSALAASTRIDAGDWAAFHLEAQRLIQSRPYWLNLILTDESRQIFNYQAFGAAMPPLHDPDAAAEVFRTQLPTLGNLRPDAEGPGTGIRVPVIRDGSVRYVLGAPALPERYSELLQSLHLPAGWDAALTDGNNIVVGHTAPPPAGVAAGEPLQSLPGVLAGGTVRRIRSALLPDRTSSLAVTVGLPIAGWHVTIWTPASLLAGPSQMLRHANWFIVAICAAMGLALLGMVFALVAGRRNFRLLALSRDRLQSSEAALQESEARMLAVIDTAMDAIITADENQKILMFNRAAERMFGHEPGAVIGRPLDLLIPERLRAAHRHHVEAFIRSGVGRRPMGLSLNAVHGLRRSGEEFPIEASISQTEVRGRRLLTVILRDITERLRSEERMKLLAEEVDHRAKNILAVVLGMISLARDATVPQLTASLTGRVMALGRTHTLLAENRWTGVDLQRVVADELAPFRGGGTPIRLAGPPLSLRPAMAQSVAITLHELATNAVKYGALSGPGGRLDVTWAENGDVMIAWSERSPRPVERPREQGMGLRVIAKTVQHQLDGEVEMAWRRDGLLCRIRFPLQRGEEAPIDFLPNVR